MDSSETSTLTETSHTPTDELKTLDPVFPIEIFGKIIDIIGTSPDGTLLSQSQSSALNSCALVCTTFLQLARDHIFRKIKVGLHGNVEDEFMRLSQTLAGERAILLCIRELTIDMDCFGEGAISEPDLDAHRDILFKIPRLQSLSVLFNSRYSSPAPYYIASFAHQLIEEYSSRGTLCFLQAKTMDSLPYHTILTNPTLRSLRLDRCLKFETWKSPASQLTKLTLRKMDIDPSFISYFPNLTDLQLLRLRILPWQDFSASSPDFLPLLKLDVSALTLESHYEYEDAGMFLPFFTFVRRQASKNGFNPFERVESLTLVITSPIKDLTSLLQDACCLKHLTVQIDAPDHFQSYRVTDELEQGLRSSLRLSPTLETLSLNIQADVSMVLYRRVVSTLEEFFSSNVLHDNLRQLILTSTIYQSEDSDSESDRLEQIGPDRRLSAPYPVIISFLTHSDNFPKLDEVNVFLSFKATDSLPEDEANINTRRLSYLKTKSEELAALKPDFDLMMDYSSNHLQSMMTFVATYRRRQNL